jgi:hypothetical protein
LTFFVKNGSIIKEFNGFCIKKVYRKAAKIFSFVAFFVEGENVEMANRKSHMARMEPKKGSMLVSVPVSERYPGVSGIVIHMTYYKKAADPVLMVRTVNFFPSSHAFFNLECMIKDCVKGGLDFTKIIANLIKKRKKSGNGKIVCSGEREALAPDHGTISYEINIEYNKKSS